MPDDARRPVIDKSRMPSRHVTIGPERAPHRAFLYSMGLTDEQIAQPLVGVATTWNESAPCNISLSRQAQAAKKGVAASGGTPREFTTITVTDGIAMGHEGMKSSLVSREVIADSVELSMRGHCYDALVGLAGCDKSLPGLMMAMLRLNVPSVFMYGGSILPGPLQRPRRNHRRRVRGGRLAQHRQALRRRAARARMRRLPVGRVLRRPLHRQHDGLRLRGDRPRAARLGRRPGALRFARRLCGGFGPGGHGIAAAQHSPARHRHQEGDRERRDRGRRRRRFDQWRAAPAGDRQRGGHRFRSARFRRDLQAHALYRRSEAGRSLCDEGSA